MRVPGPCLSQYVCLFQAEEPAVLLDGITLVHLVLALRV